MLYSGPKFYDSLNRLLEKWRDYIESNWLSPDDESLWSPENKIKWMLDGCANAILRPDMNGIITDYQKMKTGRYEIPISSYSSETEDTVYSQRRLIDNGEEASRVEVMLDRLDERYDKAYASKLPCEIRNKVRMTRTKERTKSSKIREIKGKYPGHEFMECLVDTDGYFICDGCKYRISDKRYDPVQTGEGKFYPMDKVNVVTDQDGLKHMYTQSMDAVSEDGVEQISMFDEDGEIKENF